MINNEVNEDVKHVVSKSTDEIKKYIDNEAFIKKVSNASESLQFTNTAQLIFSYPDYNRAI